MSTRRVQKVAEAIREVVSMAILTELKDPRVRDVTVIGVEVSGDLRFAKVAVSIMGDDSQQNLSLRGLQSSAGFLQSRLADKLELRYTPKLTFTLDQGVKRSVEVAKILREVLPENKADDASSELADGELSDTESSNNESPAAESLVADSPNVESHNGDSPAAAPTMPQTTLHDESAPHESPSN